MDNIKLFFSSYTGPYVSHRFALQIDVKTKKCLMGWYSYIDSCFGDRYESDGVNKGTLIEHKGNI